MVLYNEEEDLFCLFLLVLSFWRRASVLPLNFTAESALLKKCLGILSTVGVF